MKQIYLDCASTTPVDQLVANKMSKYLTLNGIYGNSSSNTHDYGWRANEAVEHARNEVASIIHSNKSEIIFTSGATESNNLAIKGVAYAYQNKGKHIITSIVEHSSVIDTCSFLKTQGFDITFLKPDNNGQIIIEQIILGCYTVWYNTIHYYTI